MTTNASVADLLKASTHWGGAWTQSGANGSGEGLLDHAFAAFLADSGADKQAPSSALSSADTNSNAQKDNAPNATILAQSTDTQVAHLRDLALALQKAISRSHQQQAANKPADTGTAKAGQASSNAPKPKSSTAGDSPSATAAKTDSAAVKDTTASTAADATPSAVKDSSGDAPVKADTQANNADDSDVNALLAELLAATQAAIHQLEQNQKNIASGSDQAKDTQTQAATASSDKNLNALAGQSVPTDGAAAEGANTDPLQKFLDLLGKINKQIAAQAAEYKKSSQASEVDRTADPTKTNVSKSGPGSRQDPTLDGLSDKIKNIATSISASADTATVQTTAVNDDTTKQDRAGNKQITAADLKNLAEKATAVAAPQAATALQLGLNKDVGSTAIDFAQISAQDKTRGSSDFDASAQDGASQDGAAATLRNFNANDIGSGSTGQTVGAPRFADQLTALRPASVTPQAGQSSAVDQVVLQLNRSVKNGNDQMSLQLHPLDLGKITVKLDFSQDGKVHGTVTADNPTTLDMLQKDSRSLERALQDAGLRTDPGSLSFNLGNPSEQKNNQASAGKDTKGQNMNGTIAANDDVGSDTLAVGAEIYYVTPQGVNIRV